MEKAPTCVQCFEDMEMAVLIKGSGAISVCTNAECPNYGVLQVGAEKLAEISSSKPNCEQDET